MSSSGSVSTLSEERGDLYDSMRTSFPHLLATSDSAAVNRRSKSLPRRSPVSASRYSDTSQDSFLSDETRSKIARHTTALSNVCRILTDLLEMRDLATGDLEELEERKVGTSRGGLITSETRGRYPRAPGELIPTEGRARHRAFTRKRRPKNPRSESSTELARSITRAEESE